MNKTRSPSTGAPVPARRTYFPKELQWLWPARYGSWIITDAEFFDWAAADFERKAATLRQSGIDVVTTFSFHFRWDWQPYWPRLLDVLGRIVAACHGHDIKVVEHHSSTLKSRYVKGAELAAFIKRNKAHGNDFRRYPRFLTNLSKDPVLKGVRYSSMYQIDLRTGRPSASYYHGYVFCPNSPDFRRLYFEYLEDIYRLGVDGIMTDDIQFMPYTYACGCKWCRKLFAKQTGYRLPPMGSDDNRFFLNFDNPAFRAFIGFREQSFVDFHRRVNEHFAKLGYVLARPNYCSSSTAVCGAVGSGYNLDRGMPYFNTAFTEVCHSEDPLTCWAWLSPELKHKSALAARFQVPAMATFYCHNPSQAYFCWALSKLLGQNHWITDMDPDVRRESDLCRKGNLFQAKYPALFVRPSSGHRIAVLFSNNTKSYYQAASDESYCDEFAGWCQQLFLSNLLFDVVLDDDLEDGAVLTKHDLLILPNAACLSNQQVGTIKRFLNAGGKVIATFETVHYDPTGNRRPAPALQDVFGIQDVRLIPAQNLWQVAPQNTMFGDLPAYIDNRRPYRQVRVVGRGTILLESVSLGLWMSSPVCVRTRYGRGEALYFSGYVGSQAKATWGLGVRGHQAGNKVGFNKTDPAMIDIVTQSVRGMLGAKRQLAAEGLPEGVLVGLHRRRDGYVLHLLNARGVGRQHGEVFGCHDEWRATPCGAFKITIRDLDIGSATLLSPDRAARHPVHVTRSRHGATLSIRKGWLRSYAVIDISRGGPKRRNR